jgi:hypothetical protein
MWPGLQGEPSESSKAGRRDVYRGSLIPAVLSLVWPRNERPSRHLLKGGLKEGILLC